MIALRRLPPHGGFIMKNSYSFNFCGIDECCRLCNDDTCQGYGMCPILRKKAEEYSAENGALAVAVLKTKNADLVDAYIFDEFRDSYPEEVREPLFVFDFSEIEYEEDFHEEYDPLDFFGDPYPDGSWQQVSDQISREADKG